MDLDKIKQVIDLINDHKLTEFSYEEHNKYKLCLKRGGQIQTSYETPAGQTQLSENPPTKVANGKEKTVESPLVGTFYAASSPEAPPYVEVGDKVEKGSIVCIIEAMKVMNEITTEFSGTVTEILVDNGAPLEYGQALFKITTD